MSHFLKCCDLMFSFKSPTIHKIRFIWSLVLINNTKIFHNISETWIGFKRKHLFKKKCDVFRKSCRLFLEIQWECFRNVLIQSSINHKITYILYLYLPDEDQYSKFGGNYQVFPKIFVDFFCFSSHGDIFFLSQYMKNIFFFMYREFCFRNVFS